jgi:antitoxin ParD1/3/4
LGAPIPIAFGSNLAYHGQGGGTVVGKVEKVSVALTPEMAAMMRRMVETGEYASVSEVVREALRDWRMLRMQREQAIEELGRLWDQGLASGTAVAGPDAFDRIRERLSRVQNGEP